MPGISNNLQFIVLFVSYTNTSPLLEPWFSIYLLLASKIADAIIPKMLKCLIITLIIRINLL